MKKTYINDVHHVMIRFSYKVTKFRIDIFVLDIKYSIVNIQISFYAEYLMERYTN